MFECRLNQFLVEILQEYNASLGLNNPPPTAQLLNAVATFVKQNTVKNINLSFDENSKELTAKATYNDNRFAETKVDLSSLEYSIDVYDLAEKLEGSESIIVDIDETNSKIEIHLDAELLGKIDRALLLPLSTPTEFELVGISNEGEQVRVKLGDGVVYDNRTKTISSKGTKLYRHRIEFIGDYTYTLYITTTISEKLDVYDYTVNAGQIISMSVQRQEDDYRNFVTIYSITTGDGYFEVFGEYVSDTGSTERFTVSNEDLDDYDITEL